MQKTMNFFKNAIENTENKKEKNIYNVFSNILESLGSLNLTKDQLVLVEKKIEDLNLGSSQDKKLKFLKIQLEQFKKFLKDELSLVEEGCYIGIGMPIGMVWGIAVAMSFGFDFGMGNETTGGLITGMIVGMFIGAVMDSRAKKENRVFKVH